MTPQALSGLGLVENWEASVMTYVTAQGIDRLKTYNKLLNSSPILLTALVNIIMTHMLVNVELRQSEFGISAGRLRFT